MEFWTAVAVLRRRWYIVVPGLVLTLVAAALLVSQVKPTYQATGKMLILQQQPKSSDSASSGGVTAATIDPSKLNATGQLGLQKFASIVAEAAADSSFKDMLVSLGGSPAYEVKPPFADVPTLTLTSTAASPEAAMESYRHLVEAVNQLIVQQQEIAGDLGPIPFIGRESITPAVATPQGGARTKALIMVTAVGGILTLGAAFAFDSMAAARARKKQEVVTTGQVTLLPNPRSPLEELSSFEAPDEPDDPGIRGSGSGPMRW